MSTVLYVYSKIRYEKLTLIKEEFIYTKHVGLKVKFT